MSIQEIQKRFSSDLTLPQSSELRGILAKFQPEDLKTVEEHRMYLELLAKFRCFGVEAIKQQGTMLLSTLESLLSVGEDGVYSNSLRFIYELIQNVDDCDYKDPSDCQLDIDFRYEQVPGRIVFTYNETGFTPNNVFAITGIAEAAKNIKSDKVEIGEKGIGFKSVFGIADKVLIQSGMFSFELHKNNFIVPVPCYEDFKPVNGTRMTLEMDRAACQQIYRDLVKQYMHKEAILNRNPILFLNKLTRLRMYFDEWRSLEFNIQRGNAQKRGEFSFEENTVISVHMRDHDRGLTLPNIDKEISCYRYTQPIIYGERECRARYGDDAPFFERQHNLIAIFPHLTEDLAGFKGMLYSFLPTQIKLTVPLLLHVPFKLDGSREFVDPRKKDAWFNYTVEELSAFLKLVYQDMARVVKRRIVDYLPTAGSYFFGRVSEKVDCLRCEKLHSQIALSNKIFLTEAGRFEDVTHIISFGKDEYIDDPALIHGLLGETTPLFVPEGQVDMKRFGARVMTDIPAKLFRRGLQDVAIFETILYWLEKNAPNIDYKRMLAEQCDVILTRTHLECIGRHRKLAEAFKDVSIKAISSNRRPDFILDKDVRLASEQFRQEIVELVNGAGIDRRLVDYLDQCGYAFFLINSGAEFVLAARNGVVLSEGEELISFSTLTAAFDNRQTFSATLKIRQASEDLDRADDRLSNEDYLMLLRNVRKSIKAAYKDKTYDNYVQIILKAGVNKERFLGEILQNADDCMYPPGEEPTFVLEVDPADEEKIIVAYNECGFTKHNVRAITAIGESTKKRLMEGKSDLIGEKGVGFKAVFGVAKDVEIHSNGFDFRLTDRLPTIPQECKPESNTVGTRMRFSLKHSAKAVIRRDDILRRCLCLRKLRKIEILHEKIEIEDNERFRVITFSGKKLSFERYVHAFEVQDAAALNERGASGIHIDERQQIVCYIPFTKSAIQEILVYNGLPTRIKSMVPLVIDAPFELTTAREDVLENRWNAIIREEVYKAILKIICAKKQDGLDVLRFVGVKTANGTTTFKNFDNEYLNRFDWLSALKELEILPVLGKKRWTSAALTDRSTLIPEFIARLSAEEDISALFGRTIINTIGKSQYIQLLELMGCRKARGGEIFYVLQMLVNANIEKESFRRGLYAYLANDGGNPFEGIGVRILELPVFPVRENSGTRFRRFPDEMYTHTSLMSSEDYCILDEKIMSADMAEQILKCVNKRILPLTRDVLNNRYRKRLRERIMSCTHSNCAETALWIKSEFEHNISAFEDCIFELRGMSDHIPMRMLNGHYRAGRKFLNITRMTFRGQLLPSMVIAPTFEAFGKRLDLPDIQRLRFDDMEEVVAGIAEVSDADIEDIQQLEHVTEIVGGLYCERLLSDEQVDKYDFQFVKLWSERLDGLSEDREFPESAVKNISRIREHIQKLFVAPNKYHLCTYTRWEPSQALNGEYTRKMYRGTKGRCFCQMCKKSWPERYIENNEIDIEPAYAWEQTRLSLCLQCSKDYILLRNNKAIRQRFVQNIMKADVANVGTCEIGIGEDRSITFTATHLAEIQEIFRQQGWGDNAPRRQES